MKVEFNQGVPEGCIEWLCKNVGEGNVTIDGFRTPKDRERWNIDRPEYDWFFERIEVPIPSTNPSMDSNSRYVPTITVKDEKMAMLFALRWL